MGVVDLARRPDGTEVALKRLTLQGSTEDIARARQRIEREAEVLTRLDHPNIVELLDVVEDGDEVTLVMAYLTGGTLADRVAKHGPAPADEVERLADALGQRAGRGPPGRRGAPRHQARQRAVRRRRRPPPGRLRRGQLARRHRRAHRDRHRRRHARVHGPGAGPRRGGRRRRPTCSRSAPRCSSPPPARARTGEASPELLMVRASQGKVRPVPRDAARAAAPTLQAMLDPRPERRPSAAALVGGPAGTVVRRPARRSAPAVAGVGRRPAGSASARCWPA